MLNTHKYITLLCAVFLITVASCRKDKGNYDYHDVNEVEINNFPDTVLVPFAGKLIVNPALKGTMNNDETKYSFKYVMEDPNLTGVKKLVTIGTEKNINVEIKQGQGKYNGFFVVTEKSTGISWTKEFTIDVAGAFATKGWFFLSEVNGNAQVQFFEEDMNNIGLFPKRYTNFLDLISDKALTKPIELKGKPQFLHVASAAIFTAEQTSKVWLYLGSEQNTEKVNITNGYLWKAPSYPFVYETATLYPAVPDWVYYPTSSEGYAFYHGELYTCYAALSQLFGIPVNKLTNGEILDLAPNMAIALSAGGLVSLGFDKTAKRFVKHISSSSRFMSTLPASSSPTGFDPNNLNMDLVWMGHTSAFSGQAVAVLKKSDATKWLARMGFSISGAFDATILEEITVPELKQAENFALDRTYGWLLYNVGGKLYKYDMDAKQNTLIKDYGNNNTITMIKSGLNGYMPSWAVVERLPGTYNATQLAPPIKGVAVGYYDPSNPGNSGKVDVWDLSSPAFRTYYSFEGFGKVKDVDYSRL